MRGIILLVLLALVGLTIAAGNKGENRKTCALYIRTDPILWFHIRRGFPGHNDYRMRGLIDSKTRHEILSIISNHVAALNYIFGETKFDGRLSHRGIKFQIQRTKIESSYDCRNYFGDSQSQYCNEDLTALDLLNLHSLEDHEDYCLAYLFTYRNFQDGLGTSFVARTDEQKGGICDKYKTFTETKNASYISIKRSLNTGIITIAKNNRLLPSTVSQLNFARLVGQNFGALDDEIDCQPGGEIGNYIMYNGATTGDRPNNNRFSACSIRSISTILDAMESGLRRNCFLTSGGAFCGNKIVEPGEECDCGLDDIECLDLCCYPRKVSLYDRERNSTAQSCSRKAQTVCSPSQGPCCDALRCQISQDRSTPCKTATACSHASVCSGQSTTCPVPEIIPNYTRCDGDNPTSVCFEGECRILSIWHSRNNSLSNGTPNYEHIP